VPLCSLSLPCGLPWWPAASASCLLLKSRLDLGLLPVLLLLALVLGLKLVSRWRTRKLVRLSFSRKGGRQ
jgi:hypothetical protein